MPGNLFCKYSKFMYFLHLSSFNNPQTFSFWGHDWYVYFNAEHGQTGMYEQALNINECFKCSFAAALDH